MTHNALISITCADRIGLVAAIAGRLFDLGTNLADATVAVLGGAAEFSAVAELPDSLPLEQVADELRTLPELSDASVSVEPFALPTERAPSGRVSHRISVSGGDRPGLIARLSEVFVQFGANIVRLNAERIPVPTGTRYALVIALFIPPENAETCLATVANTAGGLGLDCYVEPL